MPRTREQDRIYQRARRARKRAESAAAPSTAPTPPAPAGGTHGRAVEMMLTSTGLDKAAAEAPLVELVRSLARDLDSGGEISTIAQYRAALAELRRALATPVRKPPPTGAVEEDAPAAQEAPLDDLARFKAARGIG